MNSYGGGWECHRGFRRVDGSCVEVVVPENAGSHPGQQALSKG